MRVFDPTGANTEPSVSEAVPLDVLPTKGWPSSAVSGLLKSSLGKQPGSEAVLTE